jgi:hypothetical protein
LPDLDDDDARGGQEFGPGGIVHGQGSWHPTALVLPRWKLVPVRDSRAWLAMTLSEGLLAVLWGGLGWWQWAALTATAALLFGVITAGHIVAEAIERRD